MQTTNTWARVDHALRTNQSQSSCQVSGVRWDSRQVTESEVHDFLPTLLRSHAVKPCLLVLDDAWDIAQVPLDPHARHKLISISIMALA